MLINWKNSPKIGVDKILLIFVALEDLQINRMEGGVKPPIFSEILLLSTRIQLVLFRLKRFILSWNLGRKIFHNRILFLNLSLWSITWSFGIILVEFTLPFVSWIHLMTCPSYFRMVSTIILVNYNSLERS